MDVPRVLEPRAGTMQQGKDLQTAERIDILNTLGLQASVLVCPFDEKVLKMDVLDADVLFDGSSS